MDTWGRSELERILAITAAALPGEDLQDDDVVACLFDDPDPVCIIGHDDGGFVAGVARGDVAHIQLLAVDARSRRAGVGSALVREFERWAFGDRGAKAVVVGAGAPFYLFAGVDVHATAALCLFEALGYRARGAELNLSFSSRFRAPAPAGVQLRRVLEDDDVSAVVAFVGEHWPNWVAEATRGIEHAACHAAIDQEDGSVVAFGCHSVNRLGWLGPIGTDPTRRTAGVGTSLLSAIAKDVMAAGIDRVEVSWIGPIGFYAKAADATVSRVFRSLVRPRPA